MIPADADDSLRAVYAAQARRLLARLPAVLPGAAPDPATGPLLHLLKGSALAAGDRGLAELCHLAEERLLAADAASLDLLLGEIADHVAQLGTAAVVARMDQLRRRLREQFLALRKQAGSEAVLRLELDEGWLAHADVLEDLLPQLLRNALAHGDQPPQERLARGRPLRMTVVVRARCGARRWRLLVADDGRGEARPAVAPDLMAGRGWGVAAVREVMRSLPAATLRYRGRPSVGSCVRLSCAAPESTTPRPP